MIVCLVSQVFEIMLVPCLMSEQCSLCFIIMSKLKLFYILLCYIDFILIVHGEVLLKACLLYFERFSCLVFYVLIYIRDWVLVKKQNEI